MSEKDSCWEYKRREKRLEKNSFHKRPLESDSGPLDFYLKPTQKKKHLLFAN